MITLDARIPEGPVEKKWQNWLDQHGLVGPRNRAGKNVIVIGTGLVIDNGSGGNVNGNDTRLTPTATSGGFKMYFFKSGTGTVTV